MLRVICFVILASFALALQALADVVTLNSGESLVGEIVTQDDPDVVVLKHPVLGELRIPAADVKNSTLVSDTIPAAEQVETAEMEAVKAELRKEIRKEVEAEIAAAKAEAEAAAKQAEEEQRYAGLPPELRAFFMTLREWNVQLELGFAGSEGNSPSLSFRVAGSAQRETTTDRWTINAYYYHLSSDRETTNDEASLSVLKDWLFEDSPWLLWAKGFYDYNNFTDWRNRVGGFGGVGYRFFQEDDLELVGRAGVGYTYNFSGDRRSRPEAYLGLDLIRWKPLPGHQFVASVAWIPDLANFPESRTDAKIEYTYEVPNIPGLGFKIGMSNEYQSETSDDSLHNDFNWYSSLVYQF